MMGRRETSASSAHAPAADNASAIADAEFASAVLNGLSASRKTLPCRYFYDERGSRLFEDITRLPEYYPTRTEVSILSAHACAIADGDGRGLVLVEFGSGSSRKTEILLKAMPRLAAYVPIDVSADALKSAEAWLRTKFPDLAVRPLNGNFFVNFPLPRELMEFGKLGFFPGSTIGNFDRPAATALLSTFRRMLAPNGRLIIGVDLIKDEQILLDAYNDAAGVTAAFNLNLLERINSSFGPAFDLDGFRHEAIFNASKSRIEMHLVSCRDQTVHLLGRAIQFSRGETIHTEDSHKYTLTDFRSLALDAGWTPLRCWSDEREWFSVHELVAS